MPPTALETELARDIVDHLGDVQVQIFSQVAGGMIGTGDPPTVNVQWGSEGVDLSGTDSWESGPIIHVAREDYPAPAHGDYVIGPGDDTTRWRFKIWSPASGLWRIPLISDDG